MTRAPGSSTPYNSLPRGELGRRQVLASLAVASCLPAIVRPRSAWAGVAARMVPGRLAALSSVALADASGAILDSHRSETALPPASVAKIMTALYALDTLGPGYRFRTTLSLTGPVTDGTLEGDLILTGDGDPGLDTNDLARLAADLASSGISRVEGRFRVGAGALPAIEAVDAGQPMHVGYNPAISGLNLNYNRVRMAWKPGKKGPDFGFTAPGPNPEVRVAGIEGVLGTAPPPRLRLDGPREIWTLPGGEMRGTGGIWLPVRRPALHAGEVFRDLAGREGVSLPEPEVEIAANAGDGVIREIAAHESAPLDAILTGMLRYSTNLTAEIVGLRASQMRGEGPGGIAESAAAMTAWARARYGLETAVFVNHSGLSDRSLWSAADMVRVLAAEASGPLPALLPELPLLDEKRARLRAPHLRLAAKSGTLYFASGLAGYLETSERRLAFAVCSADADLRRDIDPMAAGRPAGARIWAARARNMQQALLRGWAAEYLPKPPPRPLPRPRTGQG